APGGVGAGGDAGVHLPGPASGSRGRARFRGGGVMVRNLAPLHHRGFRLLVSGQLASNVGDAFYAVALPWYVLAEHGGALLLGTVLAAYGVPRTPLLGAGGAGRGPGGAGV